MDDMRDKYSESFQSNLSDEELVSEIFRRMRICYSPLRFDTAIVAAGDEPPAGYFEIYPVNRLAEDHEPSLFTVDVIRGPFIATYLWAGTHTGGEKSFQWTEIDGENVHVQVQRTMEEGDADVVTIGIYEPSRRGRYDDGWREVLSTREPEDDR